MIYLIARGGKMHERAVQQAQPQQQAFNAYVQETAGSRSADQLAKLADLKEKGAITEEEFAAQRPRSSASGSRLRVVSVEHLRQDDRCATEVDCVRATNGRANASRPRRTGDPAFGEALLDQVGPAHPMATRPY